MGSVIRIVNYTYHVYTNSYIMSVDVLYPEDEDRNRTYIVAVPRAKTGSLDDLKSYIESDIAQQTAPIIDFTDLTWKSTKI